MLAKQFSQLDAPDYIEISELYFNIFSHTIHNSPLRSVTFNSSLLNKFTDGQLLGWNFLAEELYQKVIESASQR